MAAQIGVLSGQRKNREEVFFIAGYGKLVQETFE